MQKSKAQTTTQRGRPDRLVEKKRRATNAFYLFSFRAQQAIKVDRRQKTTSRDASTVRSANPRERFTQ